MHCLSVIDEAGSIIIPDDNIARVACFVVDVEGGRGGAKGDEGGVYAIGGDGIWLQVRVIRLRDC